MKGLQAVTVIGGVALVALGAAMAMTNPSQDTYEEYATQKLTEYIQADLCPKAPQILGTSLKDECKSFVKSNPLEIRQLIVSGTQRENYFLFSLYKTDLSISSVLPFLPSNLFPAYHVETVGALGNLYSYKAEQQ